MRDDEIITINGRHLSEETFVRLCGLVALPLVAGTGQNQAARNASIHDLARFIGVGVATRVVRALCSGCHQPVPSDAEDKDFCGFCSYSRTAKMTTVTEYAGLFVRETKGGRFIVSNQGVLGLGINVMPGATSFDTKDDAMQAIDVYKAVDEDDAKFWHLWSAIRGRRGERA